MSASYNQLAINAARPYMAVGRFVHGMAKGKLTGDRVFEYVLSQGLLSSPLKILDLGCGLGLLAALIHSCQQAQADDSWPSDWPGAPAAEQVIGIELMPKDAERGRQALAHIGPFARFVLGNIHDTPYPKIDAVVIFDVLHYLPYDAQVDVLNKIKVALGESGLLLLRIGDKSAGLGFKISQWTDRVVALARGLRKPPTFCRTLEQWETLLHEHGFHTSSTPIGNGFSFSNVLITARLGPAL